MKVLPGAGRPTRASAAAILAANDEPWTWPDVPATRPYVDAPRRPRTRRGRARRVGRGFGGPCGRRTDSVPRGPVRRPGAPGARHRAGAARGGAGRAPQRMTFSSATGGRSRLYIRAGCGRGGRCCTWRSTPARSRGGHGWPTRTVADGARRRPGSRRGPASTARPISSYYASLPDAAGSSYDAGPVAAVGWARRERARGPAAGWTTRRFGARRGSGRAALASCARPRGAAAPSGPPSRGRIRPRRRPARARRPVRRPRHVPAPRDPRPRRPERETSRTPGFARSPGSGETPGTCPGAVGARRGVAATPDGDRGRLLDRHADEAAVLGPAAVVVADALVAEQLMQHEPAVRRALADAAVGDDVLVRRHALALVERLRGRRRP